MLYRIIFKLVFTPIDAEVAHSLGTSALRFAMAIPGGRNLAACLLPAPAKTLRVRALGLDFASPLGVAAGFDKEATSFGALSALGFGFVEVGTITAQAQPGNMRPRVFRLPADRALVNSMGFPNPGAAAIASRLRCRPDNPLIGINIGKTKVVALDEAGDDYRDAVRQLAPFADYLVLNVSSPNTPGLRDMQEVELLSELVGAVRRELGRSPGQVPLLVKIGPDLSDQELDMVGDLAVRLDLDGIVAVNTTVETEGLSSSPETLRRAGYGGISGAPLKRRSLEVLRRLRARCGDSLTLISVGGIETPEDAWERILAGASLVQAYTGFVYGGPLWAVRMNHGLARLLGQAGIGSIQNAIGTGVPAGSPSPARPVDSAQAAARLAGHDGGRPA